MYWINLLLDLFLLPFLVVQTYPGSSEKKAIRILGCLTLVGIVFAYLSTFQRLTFKYNIIDILIIHSFFASIYGWVAWLSYPSIKGWIKGLCLTISAFFVFILYLFFFGPSVACGQDFSANTWHFKDNYKVTHEFFSWGFMDNGSRFLLYKTKFGIEKIIGTAEDMNHFYGRKCNVDLDMEKHFIVIKHFDVDNIARIDTLRIKDF